MAPQQDAAAAFAPEAEGARLLLIDDSISVRKIVGAMLRRNGYRVVTAGDGLVDFPVVLGKLTAGGFTGPCGIGQEATHAILKGYFLPLLAYYADANVPATDYFWRQHESFKPIGIPLGDYCPESGGETGTQDDVP